MSDKLKVAFLAIACASGSIVLGVLFFRNNANAVTEECVHSLYHLCEAKGAWAKEHHATNSATPTWSDLRPYYVGPAEWPTNKPAPRCPRPWLPRSHKSSAGITGGRPIAVDFLQT